MGRIFRKGEPGFVFLVIVLDYVVLYFGEVAIEEPAKGAR